MRPGRSIAAAIVFLAGPFIAPADAGRNDLRVIRAIIKICVAKADAVRPDFDAYYNPATRLVENNIPTVALNYEIPVWHQALYTFQKCISEQGAPLGPPQR